MSQITLHHFETFLIVAETGSFTIAAKKLGNSKAAISQTIKAMETQLQIPLFIRTTRKVTLTDEGRLLLTQCKRLQNELEIARNLISNFSHEPTGSLRISCNSSYAESNITYLVEKYIDEFPKVKVELIAEERMPNMQQEQIDVVFGVSWPVSEEVVRQEMGTTRYVLCASPEYLAKHGTPKTIKELEQHSYIHHIGRPKDEIVMDLKHKVNLNIIPKLVMNNATIMKQVALENFGIIQVHDYVVKKELEEGSLVEILSEFINPRIPLYIYYQKHRFVQPKIRQFVNLATSLADK